MITVAVSQVTVTKVDTGDGIFYTISENNFGSLHHVSFFEVGLCRILNKLEQFLKYDEYDVPPTEEVQLGEMIGFVKIWQLTGTKRSISLTKKQITELLIWLVDTDNLRKSTTGWCIVNN